MLLAALGAKNTIHGVGSTAGRLVKMPHLEFAEKPDCQHIQSGQEQHGSENHQRTVFGHDLGVVEKLFEQQPAGYTASGQDADHAHRAKEVQRPGKISQQKADGNEVEKHAKGAGNAVMGIPPPTVLIADRVRLYPHFASAGRITRLSSDPNLGMAGRCVQGLIDVLEQNYGGDLTKMPYVVNKEAFAG